MRPSTSRLVGPAAAFVLLLTAACAGPDDAAVTTGSAPVTSAATGATSPDTSSEPSSDTSSDTSTDDTRTSSDATSSDATSSDATSRDTATTDAASTSGPCTLLTAAEIATVLTDAPSQGVAAEVVGVPSCKWTQGTDQWLQTMQAPADVWARNLPAAVEQLKASGMVNDPENVRKLEEAAGIIASGKTIEPAKACELFSSMLEIQGRPKGTTTTLNIIPTKEQPLAITGQTCTDGVFSSVTLANTGGLKEPLPLARMEKLAADAHQRALEQTGN